MNHERRSTDGDDSDHRTFEERLEAALFPRLEELRQRFEAALAEHERAAAASRAADARIRVEDKAELIGLLGGISGKVDELPARIKRLEQSAHDDKIRAETRAAVMAERRELGLAPSSLPPSPAAFDGPGPSTSPGGLLAEKPTPIAEGIGRVLSAVAANIVVLGVLCSLAVGVPAAALQVGLAYLQTQPTSVNVQVEP